VRSQDPRDVARDTARDLSGILGRWPPRRRMPVIGSHVRKYPALHLRLANAHAAVEAALIEGRRRVRLDEEGEG
jgi:hypothetical protein